MFPIHQPFETLLIGYTGAWILNQQTTSSSPTSIRSVLDLALDSTAPGELPLTLLPLFCLVNGLVKKVSNGDITTVTTKSCLIFGAVVGSYQLWSLSKSFIVDSLPCQYEISFRDSMAIKILHYIQEKYIPSLNCQTRLMPSFALHERTDRLLEGNKRLGTTTIKSRGFFFGYYWLHFQIVNELSEIQRGSMDVDDIEKHNVLRLGCWWGGESILKQFLDEVLKSETGNELSIWTVAGSSIIPSHPWANHTQPSRPLDTIDLDDQIKSELREGTRIFLSRQQWYANRGIPYRRGYLFFGPAGTGKTSTAKSLASTFGGQLYTLTLDEIMDEKHLQRLFSIPKKGDFILIEDIDRLDDGVTQQENVNRLVGTWRRRRRNISLSALLNAIDGPTGLNDGVILIMTSNTSELDTALVRPGRIDQTHYFPYATHDVARSIFKRLYGDDATTQESDGATSLNLDQLADEFTQQVPAETVTPAEVQGYLIARSNPSDAVRDSGAWVEDAISRSTRRCPSTQSADVVEQEDIWMQSADM